MIFDEKIVCRLKSGAVQATIWATISEEDKEIAFRVTLLRQPDNLLDAWWNPLQFGPDDMPDLWKIAHKAQTIISQIDLEHVLAIIEGRDVEQ